MYKKIPIQRIVHLVILVGTLTSGCGLVDHKAGEKKSKDKALLALLASSQAPKKIPIIVGGISTFVEPQALTVYSGPYPMVIDDVHTGTIIENMKFSNPNGDCLIVKNSSNVTIRNSEFGPCRGTGNAIADLKHAILVQNSSNIKIEHNYVHESDKGIVVTDTTAMSVVHNTIYDIGDRFYGTNYADACAGRDTQHPNGFNFEGGGDNVLTFLHPLAINKVTGPGNEIKYNRIVNHIGRSSTSDVINTYQSRGTASSPLLIIGNRILGGGPNRSNAGIIAGDGPNGTVHYSAYITIEDNVLVNPGYNGLVVVGGHHMVVQNNYMYSEVLPWAITNPGGITDIHYCAGGVVEEAPNSCRDITYSSNTYDWPDSIGRQNGISLSICVEHVIEHGMVPPPPGSPTGAYMLQNNGCAILPGDNGQPGIVGIPFKKISDPTKDNLVEPNALPNVESTNVYQSIDPTLWRLGMFGSAPAELLDQSSCPL